MAITYDASSNITTLTPETGDGDSWDNAYTCDDILAAQPTVITKLGDSLYEITSRLYFGDNVYFKSTNESVELKTSPINPTYVIQSTSTSHIMIGEYDETYGYSSNGSSWRMYLQSISGTQYTGNTIRGEFLVYGSNLWTNSTSHTRGLEFYDSGSFRFYDSIFKNSGYLWSTDTDIKNLTWNGGGGTYDALLARGYDFSWDGFKTAQGNNGIFFSGTTNGPVDLYNYAFLYNTSGLDINNSSGHSQLIRLIDGTPTRPTCSTILSGKPGIQICNTFNVKVTNTDGEPYENAVVTLTNNEGTVVVDDTTNSDGTLDTDHIVYNYWYRNYTEGGNTDFTTHTIRVTVESGYSEYPIDIDHPISEDIVIIPEAVATIDQVLSEIQSLNNISAEDVWDAQRSNMTLDGSIGLQLKDLENTDSTQLTTEVRDAITEDHGTGLYTQGGGMLPFIDYKRIDRSIEEAIKGIKESKPEGSEIYVKLLSEQLSENKKDIIYMINKASKSNEGQKSSPVPEVIIKESKSIELVMDEIEKINRTIGSLGKNDNSEDNKKINESFVNMYKLYSNIMDSLKIVDDNNVTLFENQLKVSGKILNNLKK